MEGTVAPFDPATSTFPEGALTEVPGGTAFFPTLEADLNTNTKYLFERNYQANPKITGIIVKGKFEGKIYYYKLDLVNSRKVRYDIQRNNHYLVKIQNVLDAGAETFEEALNGDFHNNIAIDPSMEKYPNISDGLSSLEVESVLVVLTRKNQKFTQQINYYPDINSPTTDNGQIRLNKPGEGNGAVVSGTLTLSPDGLMTGFAPDVAPGETKKTTIGVMAGDLSRTIHVYFRRPYNLEPVTLDGVKRSKIKDAEQGQKTTLRFTIPEDFPDELFPLPVKIYTQGLYSKSPKVEVQLEGGTIYYLYTLRERGEHVLDFHLNNPFSEETITVSSDYFNPGTASYYPDFFTIYGKVQWFAAGKWREMEVGSVMSTKGAPTGTTMEIIAESQYKLRIPYTTTNPKIKFQYNKSAQEKTIEDLRIDNTWLRLEYSLWN